ncbi:hypothetical protein AVEN_41387-1 [Araneus ventricosus]|uniref:Uncharacterized protein n=1 Tax=Araneus ventricosus TaxID=182803 RepID=A0A4Y2SJ64_ARAVE|nr:hypothetical protein AVEN_41387-1 [Araneus ventricosus]
MSNCELLNETKKTRLIITTPPREMHTHRSSHHTTVVGVTERLTVAITAFECDRSPMFQKQQNAPLPPFCLSYEQAKWQTAVPIPDMSGFDT